MKRFRHKRAASAVRVGAEPPEKIPIRIEQPLLDGAPPAKTDSHPTSPGVKLGDAEARQLWQSYEAVTMELEFAAAVAAATKERRECEKAYWATVLSARDATVAAQTQLLQRLCTAAASQNMRLDDATIRELAPFVDPALLCASGEQENRKCKVDVSGQRVWRSIY
ncbi:hypothetical protein SPRG_02281 [Saprolegnia parasitica CBS 223.65]|uniref:Uncharacterized protein n=1 Tax=Saprolegnia parasitica (strain CBS 223.65) TaxID=695850 RepID=A0A067CSG5_SAPPC|nr:hypothetical protein SPRG_02281 [Saprolegnia parasitica CBS 223.65]KDO33473.1 hypothetical protein SPRG_02281 [Saprolegnia parasitica CBS 223.65]|eukprot:XP_012196217.1 hypothetical protein SPRG_02281 [Saprolegnia parasitica CBS 223.65]